MSSAERSIDYRPISKGNYNISYGVRGSAYKDERVRGSHSSTAENRLVRTPAKDEFSRSSSFSSKKTAGEDILRGRQTGAKRKTSNKAKKTTVQQRPDLSNMTPEQRKKYREIRKRQRKLQVLKKRCAVGAAGIIGAAALIMGGKGLMASDKFEGKSIEPDRIVFETQEVHDSGINKCDDTEFIYDDENNVVYLGDTSQTDNVVTEEELLAAAKQAQIEEVNKILEENPDVKEAFNDMEIALRRASIEYGGNIIELLEEFNDKFGLGELPLELQACVLEQESTGFFTNWKTHKVVVNKDGDTGWYQLTDIAEADFDRIASWFKKNGVSEEDITEIKKLGRNNMRGNAGHGAMILSYLNHKYDGDFEKILSAYNAGEGSVKDGYVGEKYIEECYEDHLEPLSRYGVIWDYIMDRDYFADEEDGVPHVYVNDKDGSVRYPD